MGDEIAAAQAQETVSEAPASEPAAQPAVTDFSDAQKAQIRALIQQRDGQWQTWAQQQQAQAQARRAPDPAPAKPARVEPDVDSEIASLYSDDDIGKKTRSAIDKHFNLLMKKLGIDPSQQLTRAEVERIADERTGRVREQIRSGITITQEVSNLVSRGVIDDDDAKVVQQAYSQALSNPEMAAAAENPANAPWILKGVVYDLVASGKLRPYSKPKRSTNPLQAGGPAPAARPPAADPAKSPFAAVRGMSKDKLAAVRSLGQANYERANSHG